MIQQDEKGIQIAMSGLAERIFMEKTHISIIQKKDLLLYPRKYLWLQIEEKYSNINFSHLLFFIEKYSEYGKDKRLGNAYYRIRQKSNELFSIGKFSPKKLRTTKREIKSIMNSTVSKIDGRLYLKIPYKIAYIFNAIISIVNEIENDNNISLPKELADTINITYGIAFYEKYIDVYDAFSDEFQNQNRQCIGYRLKADLKEDFHCENSIFNSLVK